MSSSLTATGLRTGALPRWALPAAVAGAVAVAVVLFVVTPLQGVADFIIVAAMELPPLSSTW